MRYIFTILFAVAVMTVAGQSKSEKRGLGYGSSSSSDLSALSKGVSWIYNWGVQPEGSALNYYEQYGFDYVPMAWNGSFDKQAMRNFLSAHPNVKYILGWNEPNFKDQANMTPSKAAELWPQIEELADEFDLKIVSPAVNYCGNCVSENGTTYTDPIKYLDDFFAACPDCRVDYIGIHCYMDYPSAMQWYVGLFKKYERPIWLTEFAAWESEHTAASQRAYMIEAVEYLESDPDVFRYAWFTGRFEDKSPYIGVLGASGVLTKLGDIYVNMPTHKKDAYVEIPARIEAEAYNNASGIKLEETTDATGVLSAADINTNDWLEYNVTATADMDFNVVVRLACATTGSIQFVENAKTIATLNYSETGGSDVWKNFSITVPLTEGQHKIRVKAANSGMKLNWVDFRDPNVLASEQDIDSEIKIYPNPSSGQLNIETTPRWQSLDVVDMMGRKKYSGAIQNTMSDLSPGVYLMKFKSRDGKLVVKRVVRK